MYKITIIKVEEKQYVSKEYQRLRDAIKQDEDDNFERKKNPQYGYVETPAVKNVETKLLELTLEELDVVEVTKKILEK